MKFQGYIFDLDGTLVDSALDFPALSVELGMVPGTPILEEVEKWQPERQAWAHEIIHRHELRGAEVSVMIPGALEFLAALKKKKKPTALFTRNSRKVALATMEKHGLEFSLVVSRDDAPPKPLPDGLHLICRNFGLGAAEVLYVGDYLFDLQAGLAASVPTALYLPSPPDFSPDGAHFHFTHYREIIAHLHS